MKNWKSGEFDRLGVAVPFQRFCPFMAFDSLPDVDLQTLWDRGKRLLLLDVDHTLAMWKTEELSSSVREWIAKAKKMGFDLCILSNTRRPERLARLSAALEVPTVRGKMKPSRAMYRLALMKFHRKPEEAVMIGDQIFTDVLGANRSGIDAVWVRKLDGREFGPTALSRVGEHLLKGVLYQAMISPVDEQSPASDKSKPIWERTIFRQFTKFCMVGGTSFVIDYCITMTLMFAIRSGDSLMSAVIGAQLIEAAPQLFAFADEPKDAFFPIASAMAASVAILNSFVWNRLWTFKIRGKAERAAQLRRFIVVSVIGLGLNVVFRTAFNAIIPGEPKDAARIAIVLSTALVAIWNFSGQRLYAFRKRTS